MKIVDSARLFVLYSDFNCPFCYALHEQLLAHGVMENVGWRGVQHAPHLPVPMARWQGRMLDELRREVALVGRLAPDLPISPPGGKPNTGPAIHLAASVLAHDPARGSEFVRLLYRLFWLDGLDISDAGVLGDALVEQGLDPQAFLVRHGPGVQMLTEWDDGWRKTGQGGVPLLERPDGTLLAGLAPETELKKFLAKF
jgi:predicted DsbA family dithiol-disulfide isomerase